MRTSASYREAARRQWEHYRSAPAYQCGDPLAFHIAPCRCGATVVRSWFEQSLTKEAECSTCRAERIETVIALRQRRAA